MLFLKLGAEDPLGHSTQPVLSTSTMPTSSEEISLIEHVARFEGLKELLEDDVDEQNPTQAEFSNVASIVIIS